MSPVDVVAFEDPFGDFSGFLLVTSAVTTEGLDQGHTRMPLHLPVPKDGLRNLAPTLTRREEEEDLFEKNCNMHQNRQTCTQTTWLISLTTLSRAKCPVYTSFWHCMVVASMLSRTSEASEEELTATTKSATLCPALAALSGSSTLGQVPFWSQGG